MDVDIYAGWTCGDIVQCDIAGLLTAIMIMLTADMVMMRLINSG